MFTTILLQNGSWLLVILKFIDDEYANYLGFPLANEQMLNYLEIAFKNIKNIKYL